MKILLAVALVGAVLIAIFSMGEANEHKLRALRFQSERDSLLISLHCPPKMTVTLPTSRCLNTEATRHDFDRHVTKLVLLCGDTLRISGFCQFCNRSVPNEKKIELLALVLENFFKQEKRFLINGIRNEQE